MPMGTLDGVATNDVMPTCVDPPLTVTVTFADEVCPELLATAIIYFVVAAGVT